MKPELEWSLDVTVMVDSLYGICDVSIAPDESLT